MSFTSLEINVFLKLENAYFYRTDTENSAYSQYYEPELLLKYAPMQLIPEKICSFDALISRLVQGTYLHKIKDIITLHKL